MLGLPSWGLTGGDSQAFASPRCVAPGCSHDTAVALSGEGAVLPPETLGQGIPDCQDWGEAVGIWWVGPGLQSHRHAVLGRGAFFPPPPTEMIQLQMARGSCGETAG